MTRLRILVAACALASVAAGYLVAHAPSGGGFVFEQVPSGRRPMHFLIDTEPVAGIGDTRVIAQDLMNRWNAIAEAEDPFGEARVGGPYNGDTVGQTFARFGDGQLDVAFDDDGAVLANFGLASGVLAITVKNINTVTGDILDVAIVVSTQPNALSPPQLAEALLRATLLHEFGHGVGLAHTAVGMSNEQSFGLCPAVPQQIPTMFPFRIPVLPAEGGTLEPDDAAGLIQIYPGDRSGLGSISGTVRGPSGAPVNEILVRAVGPTDDVESHVGVLTNEDGAEQGNFRINNLPPGPYKIVLEAVNGRGNVAGEVLGTGNALGANPFLYAVDELWQPGDTHDPAVDDPVDGVDVQVRADRDTSGVDFVLNAEPYGPGTTLFADLAEGDSLVPGEDGGFHFADYFVFAATAGADLDIELDGTGVAPQIRLFRPSDLSEELAVLPDVGTSFSRVHTPDETGLYMLVVFARDTTGNVGGAGAYSLRITGDASPPPPPPAVIDAEALLGPEDPGPQQFAAPLCDLEVMQVQIDAPSHEELWVDRITVRGSGSGDETDLTEVRLVHDENGDGVRSVFEPTLATVTFDTDNGQAVFDDLDLQFAAGSTVYLLVVVDMPQPAPQPAGFPVGWLLPLVFALGLLRARRAALAVALLAVLPLGCSGGGGGRLCNGVFDPARPVTTFTATIAAGDIVAFTPTSEPGEPVGLPAAALVSGELSVSN